MTWYWKENMTKKDNYFFNHCFYNQIPVSTLYMEYIEPLRDKLNWAALMEARANLMLRQPTSYQSHFHKDRPFFNDLVDYMTSGPVMVQVLEGDNAISLNRELMGATNPDEANEGTIRKDFATSIEQNIVHGSDGPDTAREEINFFFG
jgi:nucleoside-diphosphate kinase